MDSAPTLLPAAPARPRLRARLRLAPGLGYALAWAVSMRVALSLVAAWLLSPRPLHITSSIRAQYLGQAPLHDALLAPWQRFDALWYLRLAAHGYGAHDGSTVYFPLYPLLIKLLAVPLAGNAMLAALVVSNACFVALLILLYRFVARRHGESVARRTLLLLCVFPTAVFLLGAYTESLFLVLVVGLFLALDADRPLLAGGLGFLAALTRLQGLVLALPLLWAAWDGWQRRSLSAPLAGEPAPAGRFYARVRSRVTQLWPAPLQENRPRTVTVVGVRGPWRWPWRALRPSLAALLPPLGALLFMLYVRVVVHSGSVTDVYARQVHQQLGPPWVTLGSYWSALLAHHWQIFSYPTGNWVDLLNLVLALGMLALVLPARRVLGTGLWLYALATWVVTLCIHQSTARYMLTVFPALIALAVWAPGRRMVQLVLLLGAPLMLFVAGEFVMWSFVG